MSGHAPRLPHKVADEGFSLIELVVAMVVLGAMSVAVIGVILHTQAQSVNNRSRIAAANLAAREIDIVREEFTRSLTAPATLAAAGTVVNPHPLPDQVVGAPLEIDGKQYTVTRSVAWNATGTGASACEGGSLVNHPTLRVTVDVTWPNMGSTRPVTSSTNMAPPKAAGVLGNTSFVAVAVTASDGLPYPGRTVRVFASGESRTSSTDSAGCAVVQVTPAAGTGTNYNAQVSGVNHVDIAGNPAPLVNVGLVARGTLNSNVKLSYDRASTLVLRFVDSTGAEVDATGEDVTVSAGDASGSSRLRVLPVTGSTMTLDSLWPTQYTAFLGTVPPADGAATITLAPGSSQVLEVPLPDMGVGP